MIESKNDRKNGVNDRNCEWSKKVVNDRKKIVNDRNFFFYLSGLGISFKTFLSFYHGTDYNEKSFYQKNIFSSLIIMIKMVFLYNNKMIYDDFYHFIIDIS